MKISTTARNTFTIFHTTLAVILLGISMLFVYEKNIVTFDNYAEIYAVIPGNLEFEGDEKITFFVFSESDNYIELDVTQKLMCDYGDGNGFGMISSNESKLDIAPRDTNTVALARGVIDDNKITYNQASTKLRTLVRKTDIANFVIYDGTIPNETSQCFVKFNFSKTTPRFGIHKEQENISYPFDYVWYFTAGYSENKDQ